MNGSGGIVNFSFKCYDYKNQEAEEGRMETAAKVFIIFSALCAPLYIFLKIREAGEKRNQAQEEFFQETVNKETKDDVTEDGEE